ncbi:uncharacterized protein PADG_11745 [Paracoccidioides brasiliensis Pb18]|uniref:Uncharacterized protein n=1 Tax=Paracoccidioides brasiliensis (strain Pb18) TaxID=502780 RepID=A0A0A0HUC8_PARBD|nr:uncharacterized protein PADG_11745 [Paracoccidioides brasiliensis Pb18]KGM92207.1 hypothetical protein PADG_11745 [Paracoccidioides brasiliensis Pb18]
MNTPLLGAGVGNNRGVEGEVIRGEEVGDDMYQPSSMGNPVGDGGKVMEYTQSEWKSVSECKVMSGIFNISASFTEDARLVDTESRKYNGMAGQKCLRTRDPSGWIGY